MKLKDVMIVSLFGCRGFCHLDGLVVDYADLRDVCDFCTCVDRHDSLCADLFCHVPSNREERDDLSLLSHIGGDLLHHRLCADASDRVACGSFRGTLDREA